MLTMIGLLIVISVLSTVGAINNNNSLKCSSSCSQLTYSFPNDTRDECSHNSACLMRSVFRVIQRGSFDETINITLIGYGLSLDRDRSLSFYLQNSAERIEYGCIKSRNGLSRAWVTQGSNSTFQAGDIKSSNGTLICSWLFGKDDFLWPTHANYSKVNLIASSGYSIVLKSDNSSRTMAFDLTRLPIYRMNFLRCCFKSYGGPNYLLITNQTAHDTNIYLQAFPPIPKSITVQLVNPKGGEFSVICNATHFNASVKVGNRWSQMRDLRFYEIYQREAPFPDFRCVWSQPLILSENSGTVDTRNGRYNLEIAGDNRQPYKENTINLHGSLLSSTGSASFSFISSLHLILVSMLIQFMISV